MRILTAVLNHAKAFEVDDDVRLITLNVTRSVVIDFMNLLKNKLKNKRKS
jgi:hypothetical protein